MTNRDIAAVERDTGLSKDTLRVWERRYGFPQPARDPIGVRAYPPEQVTAGTGRASWSACRWSSCNNWASEPPARPPA